MRFLRRTAVVATAAALVLSAGAPPALAQPSHRVKAGPQAGGPGIGDVYYPDYGNSGYDVSHYDIRLRYFPDTDRLTGITTILARATADLSSFNLDFLLDVASVRVNGWAAGFARSGVHELVVTPARPVSAGQSLTVVVQYSGVPSSVSAYGFTSWKRTADGALAVNEPEVAWWWFPSNDHPLDKATFDVSVSVPTGVEVISNGVQPRPPIDELLGWTRWIWRSVRPQATYLAFMAIGQYDIVTDTAPNGQPVINAYSQQLPADLADAARSSIERTAEIIDWESGIFGPYPFEAQGGVAGPPDGISFALEDQTRPVYGPGFWRRGSNTYVVVHENAHQWFGDSVSVGQWRDIWLNEGFASYAEWLWSELQGEGTAQEVADFVYASHPADDAFWQVLPGDPGAADLFHDSVYDRGALTLHQLRLAVGDDAFFTILRRWAASQQYGNGSTDEFIALAERVSGQDLTDLFTTWLFTRGRPALPTAMRASASASAGAAQAPTAGPVPAPKSWTKLRQAHELLHAR